MRRFASEIADGREPVGPDLSLDGEVPLDDLHVLRVRIHGGRRRVQRPGCIAADILAVLDRKLIPTGVGCPGIIHLHIGQRELWRPGRSGSQADHVVGVGQIV